MKKSIWAGLFICCVFVLLTGCNQKKEHVSQVVSEKDDSPVIANINDAKITLSEFTERLKEYPSLGHGNEMDLETKKGFLDNLIVRELLYQEALRTGIDKEKETLRFIEEMKKRIVVDKFFKKTIDEVTVVSEDELREYYEGHPEEMMSPAEIRAAHILLKTRDEAEDVRKKIKGGSKFEDLARKHSSDPGSKESGGDLGFFSKGMMVPEFEKAAFELELGGVSDIVQSRFGFHIIKLLEKREARKRSFEEARKDLEKNLASKRRSEKFDSLVAELKSKAVININEDLLINEK